MAPFDCEAVVADDGTIALPTAVLTHLCLKPGGKILFRLAADGTVTLHRPEDEDSARSDPVTAFMKRTSGALSDLPELGS
jgi:hypothetical protein